MQRNLQEKKNNELKDFIFYLRLYCMYEIKTLMFFCSNEISSPEEQTFKQGI